MAHSSFLLFGGFYMMRAMEFLNFLLIFTAGCLVWRHPQRERLAFGLLVTSVVLTAVLFLIGTRGSILPPLNY